MIQQSILAFVIAVTAVVILLPTFFGLHLLVEAGLDVALPAVVVIGVLLTYLLHSGRV